MMETLDGLEHNEEDSIDKYVEFEKHLSLIHILKGQEEFLLNDAGIIISSNLEAVNITGYEEHEVLGKHISIFYAPEEINKASADLEKAANLGQSFVTGLRMKKKGTTFWAKMNIKSLPLSGRSAPRFKIVLKDITHRALSNLRVKTINDEYLAIFNNPFVGTYKFRMDDYRLLKCNQKVLEITGSNNSSDLYFNNFFNSELQFNQFIDLLKREKRVEGFKFLLRDDRIVHENWALISARYFEGRGFAEGILLDISEQHCQMLELQRVNAELDNFTYHASHDLRAPLSTIQGLVNLGIMEKSVKTIHSYLTMIQGRINHMDILLKDLISISYNNKTEPNYELFDFNEEVSSIVKTLEYPGHPFQIHLNIQQENSYTTDAVRMRTILGNLLSNAFKYFNPEVREPYIELRVRVDVRYASIQLRDNGIGIDSTYKERIYDMFFRATTRSTGTGLGLYIVKSMVDKLKGQISFESTLNEGTTFLLNIPNHINKALENLKEELNTRTE